MLEANLDDTNPEWMGFIMDRLFEAGALDVVFCPIQMKKNRPSTMVSILCHRFDKENFVNLLYTETSTLGIRIKEISRESLPRELFTFPTEFGEIDGKVSKFENKIVNFKPEFDQLRQMAQVSGLSFKEIEEKVLTIIKNKIGD